MARRCLYSAPVSAHKKRRHPCRHLKIKANRSLCVTPWEQTLLGALERLLLEEQERRLVPELALEQEFPQQEQALQLRIHRWHSQKPFRRKSNLLSNR